MPEDQVNEIHEHAKRSPADFDQFPGAYYDPYERAVRLYFPVQNTLVYHGDELVEASHLGEYPAHERLQGDCNVVGRYRTEHVHGTAGNCIQDGIVYLTESAPPVSVYGDNGNVLMYDFGWREGQHGHRHNHGKRDEEGHEGGSCIENHGGKRCSEAYGINNGRCPRVYSSCIDYNGWKPNCKGKGDRRRSSGAIAIRLF